MEQAETAIFQGIMEACAIILREWLDSMEVSSPLHLGSFRSLTPDLINTDLRPRFEPKKAFYHYDGTGRDTYIGY